MKRKSGGPNVPVSKDALANYYREMDERFMESGDENRMSSPYYRKKHQKNYLNSTDFILDMLLHFRDSGTEPSLGLQRTSGVDPSSPQSEMFLKLLTQPEALRDIYNVDMDMRGAKSPTEFFEGIPKQNAVMMAVESLLGGDTNILDVIKELDPNSNSGNSQINQEIMKQDFLDKLNEYGK